MTEGSVNPSSMNRGVVADINNNSPQEESGWTAYFEDFSNNNNREEEDNFGSSGLGSSSMVSDAASCPAWKSSSSSHQHHHNYSNDNLLLGSFSSIAASPNMIPNKLTFKRNKARRISHHDDSLEDTASSPVHSPQVSDFGRTDMSSRKTNDHFSSCLGKGGSLEHYGRVTETDDDRCELNGSGNNNNGLKKKGLCLFPLSTLVNYLG